MNSKSVVYRVHALQRMFERHINEVDVEEVLARGEVIEEYSEDIPYPSSLVLGFVRSRPIHVVVAENEEGRERIVITVYEPGKERWDDGFRKRRTR